MAVRRVAAAETPLPCLALRTLHQVGAATDDGGVAAFVEPGLVGHTVWFDVLGAGMGDPDLFGFEGVTVVTTSEAKSSASSMVVSTI